jgi:hypothetical protein
MNMSALIGKSLRIDDLVSGKIVGVFRNGKILSFISDQDGEQYEVLSRAVTIEGGLNLGHFEEEVSIILNGIPGGMSGSGIEYHLEIQKNSLTVVVAKDEDLAFVRRKIGHLRFQDQSLGLYVKVVGRMSANIYKKQKLKTSE